jgi:hypothetical protein
MALCPSCERAMARTAPQPHRAQRTTLLAVGEGDCEEAFLKHLRSLYCANHAGVSVTVRNAHGKGPGNVIGRAIAHMSNRAFDRTLALLDTDLEWTKKDREAARKKGLVLVGSTPCLEGLLLKTLGRPVPQTSNQCKAAVAQLLKADLTETTSYAQHFPKAMLEQARQKHAPELDALLKQFEL